MKYNATTFLFAILLRSPAGAQEVRIHSGPYRPPATTIAVQTDLVELGATVRDRKGTPAGGFHASDFRLLDNNIPQTITFFSEERAESAAAVAAPAGPGAGSDTAPGGNAPAPPPRYLALFFDDMHSSMTGFKRSKEAAEKLVGNGLRAGDRVGIFTGSGEVRLDFTSDTKTLLATVANVKWHPEPTALRGFGVCPTLSAYQAYVIARHLDVAAKQIATEEILACEPGTPTWVAEQEAQSAGEIAWEHLRLEPSRLLDVLIQVARHLSTESGARILLMVSPGFLTDGMEQQMAKLVDTCLRSGIVMDALDNEGCSQAGPNRRNRWGSFRGRAPVGQITAWGSEI